MIAWPSARTGAGRTKTRYSRSSAHCNRHDITRAPPPAVADSTRPSAGRPSTITTSASCRRSKTPAPSTRAGRSCPSPMLAVRMRMREAGTPELSGRALRRALRRLEVVARHVAPQRLEAVVVPGVGREDVDDHVEVVHEDPARLTQALHPLGQELVLLLEPHVDPVVDRLGLAVGPPGADD